MQWMWLTAEEDKKKVVNVLMLRLKQGLMILVTVGFRS